MPEANTRSSFIESLERRQSEENAVVHALFTYFGNKLLLDDKPLFSRAVDEVFAHSVLMSVAMEGDPQLIEEIKEQLRANGLQVKPEIVSKVVTTLLLWIYSVYLAFIECIPCCDVWRVCTIAGKIFSGEVQRREAGIELGIFEFQTFWFCKQQLEGTLGR